MKNLLLLLFTFIHSCTPIATYPPIEVDSALTFSNSANEPVPTILVATLAYAHEHFGGMDIIVFNLPEGVTDETYTIVADRLGGAVPMTSQNQIAYHITELRVRGFHAEADIIFPSTSVSHEEATVRLKSSLLEPWSVSGDRVWLVPVLNLPAPNYSQVEVVEVDATTP